MKITNDLQQQADRYNRTRSFNLNNVTKSELATWYKDTQGKVLNISCGTCIRNAMRDLVAAMDSKPKQPAIIKIPFKGITHAPLEEMSFKELKALASSKGFKGNYKKAELIELLDNA
jgi:hypothetical protein